MPENEQSERDDERGNYVEFPFETFYTNYASVSSTFFDFNILVLDRFNEDATSIKTRLVMTPAHGKLLALALAEQVRRYEERWGEIRLPPLPDADDAAVSPDASIVPEPPL
jgi:hypothetical protein